jgi:hypothetical protein
MSELKSRYRLASQDIVCEEFDGEMVILNLASGHYFGLNKSASVLLNCLLQGIPPEGLSSVEGTKISTEELFDFFRDLVTHELVAADDSRTPAPLDATIREAVKRLVEKPSLEIHDDLADLIIADPIHDTDEAFGWPAQKAA